MTSREPLLSVPPRMVRSVTRAELARRLASTTQQGLLVSSADADLTVALGTDGLRTAEELSAETLAMAGIEPDDRVAVALNSDGAGVGVLWARAAASIAAAACLWGPRQHHRLRQLLDTVEADVLVTTPSFARRLLIGSRLGADAVPRLRLLLITGEPGRHIDDIAEGFGTTVGEVWCDPVIGMAVAAGCPGEGLQVPRPGVLGLGPSRSVPALGGRRVNEWLLVPPWSSWDGTQVRTGLVAEVRPDGQLGRPQWSTGDHLLLRGRWLCLDVVADVVAREGIEEGSWSLVLGRALDGEVAAIRTTAGATSRGRLARALRNEVPVHVGVVGCRDLPVQTWSTGRPWLIDHRRQHVG